MITKPTTLSFFERIVKNKKDNSSSTSQKGSLYEWQVGKFFENKGYSVEYHGINYGYKDEGIDLIVTKEDETILVQCKNHKEKIQQKQIRAFIGDFCVFMRQHPEYKKDRTFAYFFSSHGYKKSSIAYQQNKNFLVLKRLEYIVDKNIELKNKQRQFEF